MLAKQTRRKSKSRSCNDHQDHEEDSWTTAKAARFATESRELQARYVVKVAGPRINRPPIQSIVIMVHRGSPRPSHDYPERTVFSIMCQEQLEPPHHDCPPVASVKVV